MSTLMSKYFVDLELSSQEGSALGVFLAVELIPVPLLELRAVFETGFLFAEVVRFLDAELEPTLFFLAFWLTIEMGSGYSPANTPTPSSFILNASCSD